MNIFLSGLFKETLQVVISDIPTTIISVCVTCRNSRVTVYELQSVKYNFISI